MIGVDSKTHSSSTLGAHTMRVYLNNCCFNRPFDDQLQARVRIETEAKLEIQQRVRDGKLELAWSYALEFENEANPFVERRQAIAAWRSAAVLDIVESPDVLRHARDFAAGGLRAKDALHLACAIAAKCDYFLTTDDRIVKNTGRLAEIAVMNPTQFLIEVE